MAINHINDKPFVLEDSISNESKYQSVDSLSETLKSLDSIQSQKLILSFLQKILTCQYFDPFSGKTTSYPI